MLKKHKEPASMLPPLKLPLEEALGHFRSMALKDGEGIQVALHAYRIDPLVPFSFSFSSRLFFSFSLSLFLSFSLLFFFTHVFAYMFRLHHFLFLFLSVML